MMPMCTYVITHSSASHFDTSKLVRDIECIAPMQMASSKNGVEVCGRLLDLIERADHDERVILGIVSRLG